MLEKCILAVMRVEAKEACRKEQLCGGLEAGTEVGIRAVRLLWQQHYQEEDWGFLLIDACNEFYEENRTAMLWAVLHECPSGRWLVFSCYCRWSALVIR